MNSQRDLDVFEKMINTSLDIFGSTDRNGYIRFVSEASHTILGYTNNELIGRHFSEFVHPDDILPTVQVMQGFLNSNSKFSYDNRYIHKNGQTVYLHWSGSWSEKDDFLYYVGRDVTEQKIGNAKLQEKDELHRALVEHGSDMLALFSKEIKFIYSGGSTERILGYLQGELLGVEAFSLIHPEDAPMVQQKLEQVLESEEHITISDFRFRHASGEWRWLETSLSNQLQNPAVRALVTSSRDVTERYLAKQRLMESEQRFKSMFEDNPDTVLVENRQGMIIDANRATEALFGVPRQGVINRYTSEFLPPEAAALCSKHLQEAFEGNTVKFVLKVTFEGYGQKVLKITKIPVNVNGQVLAVHTLVKDVTATTNYHNAIEEHARKLTTIFESITDAFCTIDRDWKYTYVNSEFERMTKQGKEAYLGKSFFDKSIRPADDVFYKNYQQAMDTGHSVHFDSYSEELALWLNTKAFPSEEGLSIYFSDITEKINAQKELQKLSLVASHTTNGVIITDADRKIEWVNEGFTRLTSYTLEEAIGKRPSELLHSHLTDTTPFKLVQDKMAKGESVSFEIQNQKKTGEPLWLSVQINPVFNNKNVLTQFVTIQTDITESIKSQLELEKLSLVASKVNSSVLIIDRELRIEWVNDGFTRLTGYNFEEAIGQVPFELLYNQKADTKAYQLLRKSMLDGTPVELEIFYRKKNGEDIWVSVQVNPVYNKKGELIRFVNLQTDISEKVRARKELEKLSLVASRTDNGVLITDAEGRIEWANEGFTKMTGYTLAEVVGQQPGNLLQGEETDPKTVRMMSEKLKQGIHFNTMLINYRKSGEKFWVSMDITPIQDENGLITQFIAIQKDITFRKEAEANQQKMTQELYRQNSDLQQFTYIVSHNLRAPVANALGLANLLARLQKDSPLYDTSLSHLKESVTQLDAVLKDMNTILSIRDSKGTLEKEPLSIKQKMEQALVSLQEPLQNCNGEVFIDVNPELEVLANKAYLYSIFYNLLSNAIKYRSPDRNLQVQVRCISDSEYGVLISFSDNGSGFDMSKAKDSIFKLYKRFHADKNGRGIGLYLIKTHLETMGGHIEVTSQVGIGTRFLIYLPKA